MTDHVADGSLDRTARLAGAMFLLSLLVPLLNWALIVFRLVVADDAMDTARNVVANPFLFRLNIVNELVTCVVAVVLGLALYVMLESVGRKLALLALVLKSIEAVLWAVIALGHLAALLMLNGGTPSTALEPGQVRALVGLFLGVHVPLTAIPGVFLGLNLVLFLYLLFRSKYVPRVLAGFGILSYALIFVYDLTMILAPSYSALTAVQVVGWGPSVLFEVAIGLWLLIRGVAVAQRDDPVPATPMAR